VQIVIRNETPIPQGSVTAVPRKAGEPSVRYSNKEALTHWRNMIRTKARRQGAEPHVGPMVVTCVFGMPRPKSHLHLRGGRYVIRPEYISAVPDVVPDIDKLIRAVLDSLTGVCYLDDKQVVSVHARKEYGDVTTIGVDVARRQIATEEATAWTQDAFGLGETETTDIAEGQLPMPYLRPTGG
jgi:crossover junction endodeoxyribonuclease RusA